MQNVRSTRSVQHSCVFCMLQSTLAEPCGCNRKTSNKIRTYSVLHYQQSSRHMSLQQQQVQRLLQRSRNKPEDKALQTLPSAEQHQSTANQQLLAQHCSDDEEVKLTPIDCRPVALSADVPCSSYEMFAYRPRGSSNSSQTTLTTSLGKLSLNDGSHCRRSESNVAAADDAKTTNGDCGKHSTPDDVISTGGGGTGSTNNSTRRKQDDIDPCSRRGVVAFASKLKSAPRAVAIGVLARKLRALPLAGSTKHVFTPQQERGNEDIPEGSINRLSSHVSIDSAKSTISNSSLKDLDGAEFVGSELAHYMGELNQQRLVRWDRNVQTFQICGPIVVGCDAVQFGISAVYPTIRCRIPQFISWYPNCVMLSRYREKNGMEGVCSAHRTWIICIQSYGGKRHWRHIQIGWWY